MQYTEYKIDQQQAAERMSSVLHNVAKTTGNESNALSVAIASVVKRFALHGKQRYTDYGPYWFGIKAVLQRNGHNFGDVIDTEIAREYSGKNDLETIIMADIFRELNLAINPVGTRQFTLDGYSGDYWTLVDSDMDLPG